MPKGAHLLTARPAMLMHALEALDIGGTGFLSLELAFGPPQ
jgi:hypothetical protein